MTATLFLDWLWHVLLIITIPLACGVAVLLVGEWLAPARVLPSVTVSTPGDVVIPDAVVIPDVEIIDDAGAVTVATPVFSDDEVTIVE